MGRWRRAALAAVLVVALAPTARADSLADARTAIGRSDYLAAQPALAAALEAGDASPAELAEIYKLTGIVEGALGNADAATRAFARWLSLEPNGTLPAGTSPKITRPFSAAQARVKKHGPLAVKAETAATPPAVTLVVTSDPEKLIDSARVYFVVDGKAEQRLEAEGTGRITLELEAGKRLDLRLHGLDAYGNRVVELGTTEVPIVITSSGATKLPDRSPIDPDDRALVMSRRSEPTAPRPLVLSHWVWGGVTVAVAGVAGYFAWQTRADMQELERLNANSLAHSWSDAQTVEDRARRNLLVANIAGISAGVFAAGTIVLYLTRPKATRTTERTITAVPVASGGALVVGGHF